jgi:hypothetical protein
MTRIVSMLTSPIRAMKIMRGRITHE